MKRLIMILCLCMPFLGLYAQQEEFNPTNPGDPQPYYSLTVQVSPSSAGSANITRIMATEGQELALRISPNKDFVFQQWVCGEEVLSTSTYYYYTMPARNVVITAQLVYSPESSTFDPSNPPDPEGQGEVAKRYRVTVFSSPSVGGYTNMSSFYMEEGEQSEVYAYTNTGYEFVGWYNGDRLESTTNPALLTMQDHDMSFTARFRFNPTSPVDPGANYYDATTGTLVVDRFTPNRLSDAIYNLIGYETNSVKSVTIVGEMTSSDYGAVTQFYNAEVIDLSRTTGYNAIPSWAFEGRQNLVRLLLPASVEKIGGYAFYGCTGLRELVLYAPAPPVLDEYAYDPFYGVSEELVVRVPSASMALYQASSLWSSFMILPMDVQSLNVKLPEDKVSLYQNMYLELLDTKSGLLRRYVVTNRSLYAFNSVFKGTTYQLDLRNAQGRSLGQEMINFSGNDTTVSFAQLLQPADISLRVVNSANEDLTDHATITWLDSEGKYIRKGASLTGQVEGDAFLAIVSLDETAGVIYAQPDTLRIITNSGEPTIWVTLSPLPIRTITGKVRDNNSLAPISNTTISVTQIVNGKFKKVFTGITDGDGAFAMDILDMPFEVLVSASEYKRRTIPFEEWEEEHTSIRLTPISGAKITLDFQFKPTAEGEEETVQNIYSGSNNVSYSLYNETSNKAIEEFELNYPVITIMDEVADGDVIRIDADSKIGDFMPVNTTTTIVNQSAEATLLVTELGRIQASYNTTDNESVIGCLYDVNGKLVMTDAYSGNELILSNLKDGHYTLVTMGDSKLFSSIYDLAKFGQTGLIKGTDYVANEIDVVSGKISRITIASVPLFDDTKMYYTGSNTAFTVNKSDIVIGNYLTLTGRVDFKSEYASSVSNVRLIFDIPESCSFVENAVLVGTAIGDYTLNGNQVIVPIPRINDRVRFCIVPQQTGSYAPSAFVQFDREGKTITQPIGSASFTSKALSITVPEIVAKTEIPVSGTAPGGSQVDIYDDGVLVGHTTALASGTWATTCAIKESYNLSLHTIYAKVVTPQGWELESEKKMCRYNAQAITVSVVKMYHLNPEINSNYELTFDFLNPSNKEETYVYYIYNPKFSFTIDFTNNDTALVSNVVLYVKTAKSGWHPLNASFDVKKGKWVAEGQFGDMYDGDLPVNVSVDFVLNNDTLLASSAKYNDMLSDATDGYEEYVAGTQDISRRFAQIFEAIDNAGNDADLLQEAYSQADQLFATLNDQYDLDIVVDNSFSSMTEEELDDSEAEDRARIEALLSEVDTELQQFASYYSYQEFFDYFDANTGTAIKITDCSGLNVASILADGYQCVLLDNGDSIYAKYDLDVIGYVDFKKNIHQEVVLSQVEAAMSKMVELSRRMPYYETGIVDELSKLMQKMTETRKKAKKLLSNLQNVSVNSIPANYVQKLDDARNLSSTLNDLAGVVADIVEKAQKQLSAPIESLKGKYNTLSRELGLARAHAAVSKNLDKQKYWKEVAAHIERSICPVRFILKQKWVVNVGKFIGKYSPVAGIIFQVADAMDYIGQVVAMAIHIFPCEDDMQNACYAMLDAIGIIRDIGQKIMTMLAVEAAFDGVAIGTSETVLGAVATVGVKFIVSFAVDWTTGFFIKNRIKSLDNRILALKCYDPCKNGGCKKPTNDPPGLPSNTPDKKFGIDPSGFVYEAIANNRVEGVQATIYYKDTHENMFGEQVEEEILWDASEYGQENPLYTDSRGMYRWDVPQGLWQVRFEKEGYEPTQSEWLPVPPPQLEVNIPIVQLRQPEVANAVARKDAIDITFDKFMMPSLLNTDNIFVTANEQKINGTITFLDEQTAYGDNAPSYVSKVRFVPDAEFNAPQITLTVSNRVHSYADVPMAQTFQQVFDVENATVMQQAEAIVASIPAGSAVKPGTELTLTCITEGAVIRYTLDGSTPDCLNGLEYKQPIVLYGSKQVLVKAIACADGYYPSQMIQNVYLLDESITSVEQTQSAAAHAVKLLRDGHLFILMPDGRKYTVLGQEVK